MHSSGDSGADSGNSQMFVLGTHMLFCCLAVPRRVSGRRTRRGTNKDVVLGICAGKPGLLAEIKITTAAAVAVAHTSLCRKNLAVLPRIDQ